ncbi:GATA zinc finger domain-containing protein 14-like isoform X2 [Ruditapes philippinarum]|uniref:GATA zinc finger domain-containing protein 14-like isoform X2 n=1 Tax=Ruditapes philippinarum TaxID=129788 RepID=UPI00295BDABA|nr:GATA zinc finger domain-containing protein 14-like isoform X2 [Ruditapes philippinarum]XP_060576024.1 GATA zinc finger domain-containing protein 14-like isoform X2 [Ruditapes philippinarum]XP_060576025.1 GATA zinc finger domain-containing protein 14-like isoform X2 [Ruditapes philippinarum]XP_060576027.1 GATA zinc finger domain-containing protein 14-like isoform X2 [Ruditapes philippinarum]XP_060576028.1 GATA zinc finger domain-containing protein 14-like isoform X2 [Ruditapes philippinarum]
MAAASIKEEVRHGSPGSSSMPGSSSNDGLLKPGGEHSFPALHGLIMAEDRRTKEKEMNNFQNLMEYREAPASPSASSVTTTLSLENCGSPGTPNSPPAQEQQEMDDERLPNELLDELCEDIGMKEGMELDFVEFLMEQDMGDPQQYMTPEALRSSGFPTPTNQSQANSALNTPTNKSSGENNWGNRNCGSPSYSIASSTNVTIATSSGSSSPVSKRFHMSNSGPPSPPPLTHMSNNHVFKAPQTPPTPRRPIPTSQGAMSPRSNLSVSSNQSSHSDHSSHSNHSSVHSNNNNQNVPQRCYSPRTVGGAPSPQMPHSTTGAPGYKPPPQYGQYQGQNQGQSVQKTPMAQPYQRLGRPVPPNVNVQNFQQQQQGKFMSPAASQGNLGNQSCAMNNSGNLGNMNMQGQTMNSQFNRPSDSPLDQGYFTSSDTMSTRSLDSATSTVPSSVSNHMHPVNSQQKMTMGATPQKSVHFAENSANCARQNGGLPYEPCYRTNVPDCELEEYRNSIQKMHSKMMPRLNHHVKPETAPYTVPNNNGQTSMNPFEYSNSSNNMQQFDFQQKSSGNNFGMDNNQNLVMPAYSENMSSQSNMSNMNCHMPNGPMGPMQQPQIDTFRGQSACQMQDPSKGSGIYDPVNMQNPMVKNSNCQYSGPSQGNMNENCGMMGMNQGVMGNVSQNMNQNYANGQNFQGMGQNSQNGYQGQRSMHMNMPSAAGSSGMMGFDPQFEQNRAMPGNMNMNNMENQMFPHSQGSNMNDSMGWNGGMPQTPQQPHQMGAAPQSAPMGMQGQGMGMGQGQCGQLSGVPCAIPNCNNCKNASSPNRPPMMASQQRFIQHLITDRSNAFRSHPLFPLLRDLIIADMNFSTPNFPYQLISNLPADFDKLLQNFLHRNPPAGNYQTNFAVESVVMDALKYAHHCLIEKIRQKQDQDVDKHSKSTSKSLSAIEEFCEKFDQSVRKSYIKPATLHVGGGVGPGNPGNMPNGPQMGPMGPPDMGTPQKDMKFSMGMSNMMMPGAMFMSPQAKKGLEFSGMMSPNFKSMIDFESGSECGSVVSSSSHPNKPESKKHPSLPKEAVAIMLDWLRQHKDNPYPNDDEKAMLIKQTGLTINQINYWFTNARRRILPKWAQQCKT